MRIIVMSDSHQHASLVQNLIEKHPEADWFLHLGDGEREFLEAQQSAPQHRYKNVAGNCDYAAKGKNADLLCVGGKRIFLTHGHLYAVKSGLQTLISAAKDHGADVALFGHTHIAYTGYTDGLHLLNPGSLALPRNKKASYGILDITDSGIVPFVVEV